VHELSLSSAIVDTALRHAEGRRVTAVNMRIGALRQVVPDSLVFYFEIVSRETVCEGARLEPELVGAMLRCPECEREWDPAPPPVATHGGPLDVFPGPPTFRCPGCGSGGGEGAESGEFEVESIEVEASEAKEEPCTHQGEGGRRRPRRQRHDCARQSRRLRPRLGERRQPDERARRGKTSLLERALSRGLSGIRAGVLEGDVQGSMDADRIASLHVPVTQLNTDPTFGGECHLDANMVRSAIPSLPLDEIDMLVIENVGNLVCPAEFRVGEDARVMVASIAEGEDKPLKYPLMFRTCELVLINKMDLLPHLDFDLDRFLYNLDAVHPDVERMQLSARTGQGVDQWREWLERVPERAGAAA
jgi:hydrogenase nickel incorporation protein HypB